jgi:hypothetical protein
VFEGSEAATQNISRLSPLIRTIKDVELSLDQARSVILFGRAIGVLTVFKPSTIHCGAPVPRHLNIKKSIQYPIKAIPCQIPGGSLQCNSICNGSGALLALEIEILNISGRAGGGSYGYY